MKHPLELNKRSYTSDRFGQMQVKLGIATMIKNFKFSFHENTSYPLLLDPRNIVVTSMHPILLTAEKI